MRKKKKINADITGVIYSCCEVVSNLREIRGAESAKQEREKKKTIIGERYRQKKKTMSGTHENDRAVPSAFFFPLNFKLTTKRSSY